MLYSSLKKITPYLFEITFDTLPEQGNVPPVIGGCSSFVKNGRLYRNLDWNYTETASFHVICKGFEGMGFIDGLSEADLDPYQLSQLPFHLADGRNDSGIMVSTHVLFNDWEWENEGSVGIHTLPYFILSNVKSIDELPEKLSDILGDLFIPDALTEAEYLLQFLVTDGKKTFAILPPESGSGAYVIQDISDNPKLSNFRWVNKDQVLRTELQTRPNGVERWNAMPAEPESLRFTKAYEAPTRLSEFIGIDGTTKLSTEAELLEIYERAHERYLNRTRNGETWQTMHSVVYSSGKMEELYVQEDWSENYAETEPDIEALLLQDIKADLDIRWNDSVTDRKYLNYIKDGMRYLNGKYGGKADYLREGIPRTLLFEYVRYRRDSALDVFENNFTAEITSMQIRKALNYETVEGTEPPEA